MATYIIMLAVSVLLAGAAVFYPETYQIRISKSGRLVEFRLRRLLLSLAFLPLFLVSACRYKVGVDYNNYAWIFKAINFTDEKTHVEFGYELLNKIIGFFTDNPDIIFVVTSAIIILFFAKGIIDTSSCIPYSLYLFITLGFFFYSMNSIRHFMALSIYFFAVRFMRKQEFLKFLLCIILATGFHKIALIAIPLYFILTRKFKISYYLIIAVFLAILAVFNQQILNFIFMFVYTSYKGSVYNVYSFSFFNVLLCGLCAVLSLVYYKPLLERNRANIIYINAAVFMLLFYLFCGWIPTPSRIGQYGTILFILLIPEILAVEKDRKVKSFYFVCFSLFSLLFMAVMLVQANDPTLQLLPYQTIFTR